MSTPDYTELFQLVPKDSRYGILGFVFTDDVLAASGIVSVGPRKDDAMNLDQWPWEIRFGSSQQAHAFAEKMIHSMSFISVASPIVPSDAGESRCLLNPLQLLGFSESLKLFAALKEKLSLTDEQGQYIRITAHPDLHQTNPDPTLNICIVINDMQSPKTTNEEKVAAAANAIAGFMGAQDPNNFWDQYEPDRYVYPPSQLYKALRLDVPKYMQTKEERGSTKPASTSSGLETLRDENSLKR